MKVIIKQNFIFDMLHREFIESALQKKKLKI